MSKILLYLDEDAIDDDLVQALRFRGVDVLTATEAGMCCIAMMMNNYIGQQ